MLTNLFLLQRVGYLYYSDWGLHKIGRVGLDGSNHTSLVTGIHYWINALTLCHITKKLFWADAKLDQIGYCDRDGTNCHQVRGLTLTHPFGASVFDKYIYWTDWMSKGVYRANKWTGANLKLLHHTNWEPMGIQVTRSVYCAIDIKFEFLHRSAEMLTL